MDKNTIIGLVMIGIILSVFTIFNKPSEEEIKAEKAKIELQQESREIAQKEDSIRLIKNNEASNLDTTQDASIATNDSDEVDPKSTTSN